MIITCDACGTSFKVKSSMIKETGSTVRCSKCQYLFIAYPPSTEPVTPIELMPDEKIETSIDETFGKEADEKIISEIFADDDVEDIAEEGVASGKALSDLEAEIDADMSALSEEISADLFEDAEMAFDELETDVGEPEILLSDLEEENGDMIDLADLAGEEKTVELEAMVAPEADDVIDIGFLLKTDDAAEEPVLIEDLESTEPGIEITIEDLEQETGQDIDKEEDLIYQDIEPATIEEKEEDFIDLEALEAESDQGAISVETVDAEEELDFESLETVEPETEDTVIIEAFEIGKDDVAQSEFADFEDLETDEGGDVISLETVDAEEELDFENLETAAAEEETIAAEFADVETEAEGGVEAQLEEFDAEKESEGEEPSEKAADVTGRKAPAEEEAEFEFDLDSEPEATEPAEAAADAEDLELDFDLDDTVATEATTGTAEFELDFESELDEALAEEKAADAEDAELAFDLDETVAVETPAETEEFDLDFEGESAVSKTSDEEDLGLDLDLDAFDLDLETVEGEEEDEFDLGLEPEDIDLKTQIYDMDETAEADAEDETFDLDLELEPEDKSAAEADEFVLDLDIEPEAKTDKATDSFELDFEEVIDEPGVAATEEELDFGEEEVAPSAKTSEELDLGEIEDFLDFGEDDEETQLAEPSESIQKVAEAESDTLDMDMDLDFETVTAPEEEEEAGEIDIDLETMIDEEIGLEKEVSLETTEERKQRITEEYRKEAEVVARPMEETAEVEDEETVGGEMTAVAPPPPFMEKRRLVKPILVIILVLLLSGVLIYAGIKFFGAPKEVPEMVDPSGKLQIEMIRNPEYAFVVNDSAGELLVVTGHVTNRYDQPRSHIQVKATIYNAAGKVVVTSGAYCGNMLSDSDLSVLDLETINRRLTNRGGDANANVGVKPGARVPFTVIFSNLPENIDEMTVEVVASTP